MSIVLDSSGQEYLYAANPGGELSKPVTMAAWVKSTTIAEYQACFTLTNDIDEFLLLQLRGPAAGNPIAGMEYATAWKWAETTSGYTANNWHHIAVTFVSATERNVFIDGGNKGTNTDSQDVIFSFLGAAFVGTHKSVGGSFFDGKIAEVAYWKAELTDVQISNLANGYQLPSSIESDSLIAYWKLLDDYADYSGNGRTIEAKRGTPSFSDDHPTGSAPTKATNPTPSNAADDTTLDQATVTWEDGGGATSYDVYYGTESGNLTLLESGVTDLSYTIFEIDDGSPFDYEVTRYWRIDAVNDAGTTTGDEWSFTTITFNAPAAGGRGGEGGTAGGVVSDGQSNIKTRLVAFANNKVWYEDV
jgi:hypothetical protein